MSFDRELDMHRLLTLGLLLVAAIAPLASQQDMPAPGERGILLSQDREGGMNVVLAVRQTAFYIGQPSTSVPAEPRAGAALTASRFSIRTWMDGDRATVVVYAVINERASGRELETPIAVYRLPDGGHPVRVTETEQWGAAPITLRLIRPLRR
jgi:hypothetical protein